MFCSTPGCSAEAVQKCGNDCGTFYCSKKECEIRHFEHAKTCIEVKITVDNVEFDLPNDVILKIAMSNETFYDAIEFLRPFLNNENFSEWLKNKPRFLSFLVKWVHNETIIDDTAYLLHLTHWDNKLKLYFYSMRAGHKMTPDEILTFAVEKGYFNVAKFAIETGAANITTKLLYDSIDTNYAISLLLIQKGANLDDACIDLALKRQKDVFLLDLIESHNISLSKLLEFALRNNNSFFVSMAIKYGVPLNTNVLLQIVESKDLRSLEIALKKGFEPETDFQQALMIAVVKNDLRMTELIYKTKPMKIPHGSLVIAAHNGNLPLLIYLLYRTDRTFELYEELMRTTQDFKVLKYLEEYRKTYFALKK